ncbi:Ubiquinone biosynthesis protein coq9, mitochondrial [Coemansia interrupta]|uniref:Ubiquinone biosynthesis protein n=1 Tax=Coemansia interrupta TaxID=1126814 RepID=A0A9W8H685_9FUNG|nr:Ubiquinone biosynthesis protein coq9, mitochondrial [Coemansia interrupta]
MNRIPLRILRRTLTTAQPAATATSILDRALTKVPTHGWTTAAVSAAAIDLGLSPASSGLASQPVALVTHFLAQALSNTLIDADDQLHELPTPHERLRLLCRIRLRQTLPIKDRWPEALALLAQPQNLSTAMGHLTELASELCYAADVQAANLDWYAKRSALAAAYVASELYLCEDRSPDHQLTWRFLDSRLDEIESARALCNGASNYASQFSRNIYNIFASRGFK